MEERKETIDDAGDVLEQEETSPDDAPHDEFAYQEGKVLEGRIEETDGTDLPRKYYVDGGEVEIIRHLVYDLDPDGRKLSCRQLTDYAGDKLRTLYPDASALRRDWLDAERRAEIVTRLAERGIDLAVLAEAAGQPAADPFDPAVPSGLPRAAADAARAGRAPCTGKNASSSGANGPEARQVLDALIDKYAEHGAAQFKLPEILEVAPFNEWGNVIEIAARFGGSAQLRGAVAELQAPPVRRLNRIGRAGARVNESIRLRTWRGRLGHSPILAPRVLPCYIWRV